jgi:hypothetical protein
MAKKIIFGMLLVIMIASVSACASTDSSHDDASMNHDSSTNNNDQTQFTIGGYTKILVGGEVK